MESEKVTREVAQTAQDYMEQHHGVCLKASEWDAFSKAAIAAFIEAVRDPSPDMLDAGYGEIGYMGCDPRDAVDCWQAMLDALMQEGK